MSMIGRIRRKYFGEILVNEGIVSKEQLEEALQIQKDSGDFLGGILLELGYINESDIVRTLCLQYQLPYVRPSHYDFDRKLAQKFPAEFLHLHKLLPLDQMGELLLLVVTEIPTEETLKEIQGVAQSNLAIYIGSISEVEQILKEVAPIGEAGAERIRVKRRGRALQNLTQEEGEEIIEESDLEPERGSDRKKESIISLDTSWESIFDEAEGKVRNDGDAE